MAEIKKTKEPDTEHLVLEALYYQQTNMRRGDAAMKTRGEVSGGGAKPWRQKGTGRARQGSTRAVQWRGGGRAFGSRKHVYDLKMNKKARRAALNALFAAKLQEGRILVDDSFNPEAPSTKAFINFLIEKEVDGKVLLLYTGATPKAILKSARNVPEVTLLCDSRLNAKDILNADWLFMTKAGQGE